MPHQCTDCGREFDDGSTEMLSGCPDCGGNKFQFMPAGDDPDPEAEPPDPPEPPAGGGGSVARTVGNAATKVRDVVSENPPEPTPESEPEPSPATPAAETPAEDTAQASARSEVVSREELAAVGSQPTPQGESGAAERPDRDRPDLADLRAELNDQFESIKVLDPGKYELNLMELYDREEYIIALQEDGKYTIQVPERWDD
jgi:hypothetical protein